MPWADNKVEQIPRYVYQCKTPRQRINVWASKIIRARQYLYARYIRSHAHVVCKIPLLARALGLGQARDDKVSCIQTRTRPNG